MEEALSSSSFTARGTRASMQQPLLDVWVARMFHQDPLRAIPSSGRSQSVTLSRSTVPCLLAASLATSPRGASCDRVPGA